MTGRPSDDALWASVEQTLSDIVLPALEDPFARNSAVQLVGLARYARTRGADPSGERLADLRACLDRLRDNEIVRAQMEPGDDPTASASAALVRAVGRNDAAGDQIRRELRPLLVRHLDDDLAMTSVLLGAFRGKLPDD